MKKVLTLLLSVIMIISLSACGEKESGEKEKSKKFLGTWKIECIEYEGAKFSVEEWKNMENSDFSDFYIIFKDGGKAYIYDEGYGELVNWLKSNNKIMIGDEKCTIVDGMICLDYYGDKLYLKKTSNNQEIPKNNAVEEDDYTIDEDEWREFLSDYEEWVDEYIEMVAEYKENPTDTSILSDYTDMLSEMADWIEEADDMKLELEDSDDALEFASELSRIAGKLAEVAK